jgi:CheY-like chemotaxis protein
MSDSQLFILVLGNTDRSEFRDPVSELRSLGRVTIAKDVSSAVDLISGGEVVPDVVVVAQAFPGQFSADAIDRLRRAAPLARVVGLLGTWCEGETRTGWPWPAAIRVYWHQWQPQCEQELGRIAAGKASTWALPITAGDEERLLAASHQRLLTKNGHIAISTPLFDMQDWLQRICRSRGYSTSWIRPHQSVERGQVTAAIFDADECSGKELDALKRLVDAIDPAPVVALMDFPRVESRDRALAAGARAVLSKPLLVDDLFWQLDRLIRDHVEAPVE